MRALALVVLGLAGCLSDIVPLYQREVTDDAGSSEQPMDNTSPDMGGGGLTTAGPDMAIDCVPKSAALGDGHHNPGLNCMTCHDGNTAGAPKYTVAGTLYDSIAGTNPVAGATIQVTQGATKVNIPTMANGNFYLEAAVTFPFQTRATGCPDTVPMLGAVQAAGGSCNQAGCHDNATNRIHLP